MLRSTDKETALWQEEFRLATDNGKGFLTPNEAKDLIRKYTSLTQRSSRRLSCLNIDKDQDGIIDCKQYCALRRIFLNQTIMPATTARKKPAVTTRKRKHDEAALSVFDQISDLTTCKMLSTDSVEAAEAVIQLEALLSTRETYKYFAELGGHRHLVTLMKSWKDDIIMCRSLLYHMVQFIYRYGNEDKAIIASMLSAGSIETIAGIFFRFKMDKEIATLSMNAVGNLIWTSAEYRKAIRTFVTYSGVKLATHAMMRFPDDAGVQDAGCYVLNHLCFGDVTDEVLTVTTMALVGKAVMRFRDNDDIRERAQSIMDVALCNE